MTKINAYAVQVLRLVLAVTVTTVCRGQVNVTVGDRDGVKPITAVEHFPTTITCQYVIDPDHSYTLEGLQWKIGASNAGSDSIGSISSGGAVNYDPPYDAPDYVISSTDTSKGCNLTIRNTSLADNGTYRCAVFIREPSLVPYYGSARMEVYPFVAVSSFMMQDEDGNSIKENSTVFLDSNKASYMFSFVVPGIYPGIAAFMWTVGGTKLPGVRLPDVPDEAGLITSSSSASLTTKKEYHEKRLQCQAMDRDGKVVASLGVILDITSPGGAGSILYRLDVILACLALTAVHMFNHGI